MGTGVLLYPNWLDAADTPVRLWGGSWLRRAPLDNLRDRLRVNAAISRDAVPDNTWLRIDLGEPRNVMGWAIPWHELGRYATIDVRGYWDGACTLEVPEAAVLGKEVYPEIYPWGILGALGNDAEPFIGRLALRVTTAPRPLARVNGPWPTA